MARPKKAEKVEVQETKVAKTKAPKQPPKPSLVYEVSVTSLEPTIELKGTIADVSGGKLVITHKKHHSKKMLTSVIPLSQVILYANPGVPKEGRVLVKARQGVELADFMAKEVEPLDNGFVRLITEDGEEYVVESSSVKIVADNEEATRLNLEQRRAEKEEEEAAGPKRPGRKPKAQVVAVADEDEDEEYDSDEEDEEYDAEDEEDEEDEDEEWDN